MLEMKEIKSTIISLSNENKYLKSLNIEKDKIIDKLMYEVEKLENDLGKRNVKRLVLTNRSVIK